LVPPARPLAPDAAPRGQRPPAARHGRPAQRLRPGRAAGARPRVPRPGRGGRRGPVAPGAARARRAADPMAIFLTITLVEMLVQGQTSFSWSFLALLAQQFGIGAICGLAGGFFLTWLVNRVQLDTGLYPLLITSGAILVFAVTNILEGSGFLAIFLTGLVLGNSRLRSLQNILHMQDGMAWLSQIGLFLMLGLLVTPSEMVVIALPALAIAFFLILVARPIAVLVCLAPFSFSWRERLFISWVGLRGAVPVMLAIFPLVAGLEQAQLLFNLAFVVVLVSLLLQGAS